MKSNRVTTVIGIALLYLVPTAPAMAQVFPGGGLPMAFNGGFAGETGKHRLISSTHLDLISYEKRNTRFGQTFSYDVFVPSLRSGIGVMAGYRSDHYKPSDSLNWELRNPYVSISFSPKISFGGKLTLAPFVDFQLVHSRSVANYHRNRVDPPMMPTNSRYTLRLGVLLNSRKGYVGLTFVPFEKARITEEDYSHRFINYYYGADTTKLILQAGRTFQKAPDSKFSFTPQFAVSVYRLFNRYRLSLADLNLAFRFNRFHTGIGAGGFQFAYDWDRLRVGTALFYTRIGPKGQRAFVNGQLTEITPYRYSQFISVRYLIDAKARTTSD